MLKVSDLSPESRAEIADEANEIKAHELGILGYALDPKISPGDVTAALKAYEKLTKCNCRRI